MPSSINRQLCQASAFSAFHDHDSLAHARRCLIVSLIIKILYVSMSASPLGLRVGS